MEGLVVFLWWLALLGLIACFVPHSKNRIATYFPIGRVRLGLLIGFVALSGILGAITSQDSQTSGKPDVAAAPASESASPTDFAARLPKEEAMEAAETKAPITATELEHGIGALCEATMQQVNEVVSGRKQAEDTSPFVTVAAAGKILMNRYGDSQYRAVAIIGAANKDMQANDPSGNLVEFCTRRSGG
jgi:hypothetical protein